MPATGGLTSARDESNSPKSNTVDINGNTKPSSEATKNRYQRKQIARLTAERNQATKALKVTQARLRQLESQLQALVSRPKVEVVFLALQLFLVARIGFRAVSRVLNSPRLGSWHQERTRARKPSSIG